MISYEAYPPDHLEKALLTRSIGCHDRCCSEDDRQPSDKQEIRGRSLVDDGVQGESPFVNRHQPDDRERKGRVDARIPRLILSLAELETTSY